MPAVDLFVNACRAEQIANKCDSYFAESGEDPRWVSKKCTASDLCRSSERETFASIAGCAQSFLEVPIDTVTGIADLTRAGWNGVRNQYKTVEQFLKTCAPDPVCRKMTARTLPEFESMPESELAVELSRMSDQDLFRRKLEAEDQRYRIARDDLANRYFRDEIPDPLRANFKRAIQTAEKFFQKKKIQFRCYNSESRVALACYYAFSLIDPGVASVYASKVLKAHKLNVEKILQETNATGKNLVLNEKSADEVRRQRRIHESDFKIKEDRTPEEIAEAKRKRSEFLTQYLDRKTGSEKENREWMQIASKTRRNKNADGVFFDVENSVLKDLNDTVKDKDLVTSFNNLYKEIFDRRLRELLKDPKYKNIKVKKYSDYKSLRRHFDGDLPPSFSDDLNNLYLKSNNEFAEQIKELKILRSEEIDPKKWFRSGIGQTADEASSAARIARGDGDTIQMRNFSDPYIRKSYETAHVETIRLNQEIQKRLPSDSPLLIKNQEKGIVSVSEDTWELVRKAESSQELAKKIQARFGQSIGVEDAQVLIDYGKKVDQFSPALHVAKQESANLQTAVSGGFSADFRGMGAFNYGATERALLASKNVDESLVLARGGEQEVTQIFSKKKTRYKELVKEAFKESGVTEFKTVCSGDDCVTLPNRPLTAKEKNHVVDKLSRHHETKSIRVSFINPGVTPNSRTILAVHGEAIEKNMRARLEGKIGREKLEHLLFAIDMDTTTLKRGPINLVIGKDQVHLTKAETQFIQNDFAAAIADLNKSLAKDGTASYFPGKNNY